MTSKTSTAEFIHLRYAFRAARNAIVSFAFIFKTKNEPSFFKSAADRMVVAFLVSGSTALKIVSKRFFDVNFKRTLAAAFIVLVPQANARYWRQMI
jgi:hypothetical protein